MDLVKFYAGEKEAYLGRCRLLLAFSPKIREHVKECEYMNQNRRVPKQEKICTDFFHKVDWQK